VKARRAGLMSRSAAAAEQGEDIEQIDAEIAADQARADKLGLRLDSDPRHDIQRGA
jgi:capsid protein